MMQDGSHRCQQTDANQEPAASRSVVKCLLLQVIFCKIPSQQPLLLCSVKMKWRIICCAIVALAAYSCEESRKSDDSEDAGMEKFIATSEWQKVKKG